MYQLIVTFLLFLTAVYCQDSGYLIFNVYGNDDNCTIITNQQISTFGECIATGKSSVIYSTSSATSSSYNSTYFSTPDCTGQASASDSTSYNQCISGIYKYEYAASVPSFSGIVSAAAPSCGATPVKYSVQPLDTCLPGFSPGGSAIFSYYGGRICLILSYDTPNCTGSTTSIQSFPELTCDAQGNSYGCAINGDYLPVSTLTPTFGSDVIVTPLYGSADCSGTPESTYYQRLVGCDGHGVKNTVEEDGAYYNYYDNYNCTGFLFNSIKVKNFTVCEQSEDGTSSETAPGSFPANYNDVFAIVYQDSCTAPTVAYLAATTEVGCIAQNSTSAATASCVQSGANNTITISTYSNLQCTGTAEIDVVSYAICGPADQEGLPANAVLSSYCPSSSTSGPTASPSTTSTVAPSTTGSPTSSPTARPTASPTASPTATPTSVPTATPTPRASTTGGNTTTSSGTGSTTSRPATTTSSASFVSVSALLAIAFVVAML